MKEQSKESLNDLGKKNDIVSNEELQEASYSSDSTVENVNNDTSSILESSNEIAKSNNDSNNSNVVNNNNENSTKKSNDNNKNIINKTPVESVINNNIDTNTNTNSNTSVIMENNVDSNNNLVDNAISENNSDENTEVELNFKAPVSGEIIKDFATDTLVYSNTLEEWTTHNGIDIKADKTTIVTASEEGTVESIKNDPRYGLTITIAHANGFKTVYSNLLTTEFVTETEIVEKGQTIATVGESSSFEVADDAHLHFEMYKDGTVVNPTIYLKDI